MLPCSGEHGVNILAFQSFVEQGESLARFVVDDPAGALVVLRSLRANFEEDDVAVVTLEHRPGEVGRAALDPGRKPDQHQLLRLRAATGSTRPMAVFGVTRYTCGGPPRRTCGQASAIAAKRALAFSPGACCLLSSSGSSSAVGQNWIWRIIVALEVAPMQLSESIRPF